MWNWKNSTTTEISTGSCYQATSGTRYRHSGGEIFSIKYTIGLVTIYIFQGNQPGSRQVHPPQKWLGCYYFVGRQIFSPIEVRPVHFKMGCQKRETTKPTNDFFAHDFIFYSSISTTTGLACRIACRSSCRRWVKRRARFEQTFLIFCVVIWCHKYFCMMIQSNKTDVGWYKKK